MRESSLVREEFESCRSKAKVISDSFINFTCHLSKLSASDNHDYAIKRFRIYWLFRLLISTNTKDVIVTGCHLNTAAENICSFLTCLPVFHAHVLGKCVNVSFVL